MKHIDLVSLARNNVMQQAVWALLNPDAIACPSPTNCSQPYLRVHDNWVDAASATKPAMNQCSKAALVNCTHPSCCRPMRPHTTPFPEENPY